MNKIKVMSIFGTRPEAIKMCPLVKELDKYDEIKNLVCVTGQHRQMLDQVLDIFDVKPTFDLNIMKDKQTLTTVTSGVLTELDEIFKEFKPDIVLVHGDTTTTFVASLTAFYNQIKVGHVEAGLRTFDKYSPFPEEMNRKLTGALADLHFAPTETSRQNLLREGINENTIFLTGNTVIDAMENTVKDDFKFRNETLQNIDFKNKKVIMMTAHRRENWDRLDDICKAVGTIAKENEDVEVVYLVHLNPIVQDAAKKHLGDIKNVHLLPPLDMDETHNLMSRSFMIMTDSGGIQEEAPHLGKPVLVLRDTTERPEAVEAGTVKLAGNTYSEIIENANSLLHNESEYNKMSNAANPYGDGEASRRIAENILYYFGKRNTPSDSFGK